MQYYRVNRVRCRCCGDVLEQVHLTKEIQSYRMMTCTCGKVSLDPSVTMYRIVGNVEDYEDTSEPWQEGCVDRWTGERIVPGNPEACAGNVEHGGHSCDECDHFLHCFPECDPDFCSDRQDAFLHAMMETYPGTLLSETEQAFLDAFQRYYDASPEDVEWARKQLRRKREHNLSDEALDEIAYLATLDVLASEEAEG